MFPARLKGLNEKLTLAATALLIFSMGVLLAGRESFLEELGAVGWASVLFCLVPVAFSTIAVYGLTNLFLSDIARRPPGRAWPLRRTAPPGEARHRAARRS